MKRFFFAIIMISWFVTGAYGADLTGYLPKNTDIAYQLCHLDSQPVWQEILDTYRDKLAKQNDSNLMLLSYILRQFKFQAIAGGYSQDAQGNHNVLVLQPQLTGQGEQFNKFLVENLGSFVAIDQNWHKKEEGGTKIYFDGRGENNEKLTSFTVTDDRIILASNSNLVNQSLNAAGKQNSITASTWYPDLLKAALKNYDGVVGINNQNRNFTKELKKWEQDNKMVVLLSSDWINSLGLSFAFLSETRLQGRIVFQCSEAGKVALVKSDAEFLGEVAKRRYSNSQLDIKSKVTVNGTKVILDFEAINWRPVMEQEMHK